MEYNTRAQSPGRTCHSKTKIKTVPIFMMLAAWLMGQPWRTKVTLVFMDLAGASLGLLLGFWISKIYLGVEADIINYLSPTLTYCILLIFIISLKDGYKPLTCRRPEEELRIIVIGSMWAILLVIVVNFIINKASIFSRNILIIGYLSSLLLLFILRFGLREMLKKLWAYGLVKENIIIVGDHFTDIQWLLKHLHIQRYCALFILGYLAKSPSKEVNTNLDYLGTFENLKEISQQKRIDKVFFAMRGYSDNRHQMLISRLEECARLKITALVISRIFNDFNFCLTLDGYSSIFAVEQKKPAYSRALFCLVKRVMDIMGSLIISLFIMPVWLAVILCIKLDDGGPIFFRHRLLGKDGKPIYILKFRTMVENAQKILENNSELYRKFNENYKLEDDPRVTRVGKWLRKTSLDEIPQFINILKGDMSLVGPRPVKEEEIERFGDFKHERLKIRPGLTGYWQVSGRCATSYEERVQMDKFYMYKCNIWMDLVILLKTPFAVITGHGAV